MENSQNFTTLLFLHVWTVGNIVSLALTSCEVVVNLFPSCGFAQRHGSFRRLHRDAQQAILYIHSLHWLVRCHMRGRLKRQRQNLHFQLVSLNKNKIKSVQFMHWLPEVLFCLGSHLSHFSFRWNDDDVAQRRTRLWSLWGFTVCCSGCRVSKINEKVT